MKPPPRIKPPIMVLAPPPRQLPTQTANRIIHHCIKLTNSINPQSASNRIKPFGLSLETLLEYRVPLKPHAAPQSHTERRGHMVHWCGEQ